jgi:[protein-PII] uridylyltransferase
MAPPLRRNEVLEDRGLRGREFARAWTSVLEGWLGELFDDAAAGSSRLALVAVGGEGRREMAPYSDLDLLLLCEDPAVAEGVAEKLWYPVWDAGLKLGHAVRNLRDTLALAAEDLETATALLSARHVRGDAEMTAELAERARSSWRKRGRRWLQDLADAVEQRHAAAGEVAFALEPELKEGRGGLRDVHALRWALHAGAELDVGALDALGAHHDVLFDVRVELHRSQARPGDRLLLQEQDAVAARVGDLDADALMARVASAGRSIAFASDEAWHDIRSSLSGSLFGRFRRERRVDDELVLQSGRVALTPPVVEVQDPFLVLRVAERAAREDARIDPATLDALAAAPAPPVPWPESARRSFCELLLCGPPMVAVAEILDRWGLWVRLMPEWEPTQSRPQRNAYHRFTVDRHLLETAAEAAALEHRVPRPDLLVVAALLHDLGKAYPQRGDHSVVGTELAGGIARRMGFSEADTATVVALVRHHLLLADVATRRDLDAPATVEFVAREIGTPDRLALLWALTEADSMATGSAAWSPWKAELVERLCSRAAALMAGSSAASPSVGDPEAFPRPEQRRLLASREVQVRTEGDAITVCCPDRPGVFFRVAGALALHGLDVVEANVWSEDEMALDEFRVRPGGAGVVPWDRVSVDVVKVLEGRLALQSRVSERARSQRRRRRATIHEFAPTVRFDNGDSAPTTVIEVVGPDSFGLLYRLGRALAEFNLNVIAARIHTMGHDVVDAFHVTDGDGGRVVDEDLQVEIRRALLDALEIET